MKTNDLLNLAAVCLWFLFFSFRFYWLAWIGVCKSISSAFTFALYCFDFVQLIYLNAFLPLANCGFDATQTIATHPHHSFNLVCFVLQKKCLSNPISQIFMSFLSENDPNRHVNQHTVCQSNKSPKVLRTNNNNNNKIPSNKHTIFLFFMQLFNRNVAQTNSNSVFKVAIFFSKIKCKRQKNAMKSKSPSTIDSNHHITAAPI